MDRPRYWRAMLAFLLCSLGSMGVGYVVYGAKIFRPELVLSQFVISGLVVGVFVANFIATVRPWSLLVIAAAYLLLVLKTWSLDLGLTFRFAMYIGTLFLATWASLANSQKFPRPVLGKFLLWAAIFGALHLVSTQILSLAMSTPAMPGLVNYSGRLGAWIGAGAGLGYELSTLIGSRCRFLKSPPPAG